MNLLEDIGKLCICRDGPTVPGCPEHAPVYGEPLPVATPQSIHAMLVRLIRNQEKIMTALDNLQAADTALKNEVTQAITDWQAQLAAAAANDPAIQAVADDMSATVAQLQGADPANATGGTTVSTGDGSTGTPAA